MDNGILENIDVNIDDSLYQESNEPVDKTIVDTDNISSTIDDEFVEKVRRRVIKGQIDGN